MQIIKNKVLSPIKGLKREYLPLLLVYFAAGLTGITQIAFTFFKRDALNLSAADFASIAIWAMLPWTVKPVFGSIIDGIKILGNNRKSYIYIGAILTMIGSAFWVDFAHNAYLIKWLGEYAAVTLAMLITQIGVVIQDLTADTMAVEVVKDRNERQLGMVQVLSRLFYQFGALAGALLSGIVATSLPLWSAFGINVITPIIAIAGASFVKIDDVNCEPLNKKVLLQGLAFGVLCVLAPILDVPYTTEIIFTASLAYCIYLIKDLVRALESSHRSTFLRACIGIFLFRCVPYAGEGISWWLMDVVKMDQMDFAFLRQISFVISIIFVWLLADIITQSKIRTTLFYLAALDVLFQIPEIGVYFGLHQLAGLEAKSVVLFSAAMASPVGALSMIPLGVLIAKYAPRSSKALYFAATAGLMNVALQAGNLLTMWMNKWYIVPRGDYSNLGTLMIIVLILSIVLPLSGIMIIKRKS